MPISVECLFCGKKYRVKDQLAGRSIPCKECGGEIDVPGDDGGGLFGDAPVRRSRPAGGRRPAGRRRPGKSGGGLPPALLWGGIGGGMLLVLVVAVVFVVRGLGGRAGGARQPDLQGVQNESPFGAPGARPGAGGGPGERSRFDLPVAEQPAPGGGAPKSPGFEGPPNPSAGQGFGSVVGAIEASPHGNRGNEYQILKEEPDVTRPNFWDVEPDPAPAIGSNPEGNVRIPAGGSSWNTEAEQVGFDSLGKVRIRVPDGSSRLADTVVVPDVYSPVVAVGQNGAARDTREIWNISTDEKIGTIKGPAVAARTEAMSPDGKFFAFQGMPRSKGIVVWDVEKKEALGELNYEEINGFYSVVEFPRPNWLAAAGNTSPLRIWELPSGKVVRDVDTGAWFSSSVHAYSPGGKYLVVMETSGFDHKIMLFDLDTGDSVGEIPIPKYEVIGGLRPVGVTVSPDGTEIAALCNSWECSKIFIWGMTNGRLADHMTFEKKLIDVIIGNPFFKGTILSFFPRNQRLLAYDHGVIDRETGALVLPIPKSNAKLPGKRVPLDENHVSVVDQTGNRRSVMVYELPADKLAEGIAKAKEHLEKTEDTVPVVETRLAGVSPPDFSRMRYVVPDGETSWSMQSDPVPDADASNSLPRPMPLTATRGSVRQVHVSHPAAARAVLLRSTGWIPFNRIPVGNVAPSQLSSFRWHGIDREERKVWIDVYDLAAGERTLQIKPEFDCDLLGVSPDGGKLLLWIANNDGRLDVYETETGEHFAAWQPYFGEGGDTKFHPGGGKADQLTGAAFVGNDHVATLNGLGKLVVWELASLQAVFAAENASQPSFSPGGKYVGYADAERYNFVETATGELKGSIPDVGSVQAVAFHPQGHKLAILTEYNGGYYLIVADVASGGANPPIPVPIGGAAVQWCGDKYLLLDNARLVDLEARTVAWTYELKSGGHLPMSADDRHWYLTLPQDKDDVAALAAVELPEPRVEARLSSIALQPEYVMQPGGKISLYYEVIDPPGKSNFRQDVHNAVVAALAKNKITPDKDQPVTLAVTMKMETGDQMELEIKKFGSFERERLSIQRKTLTIKTAYVYQGAPVWENVVTSSNAVFGMRMLQDKTPEQLLEEQLWGGADGFLKNLVLPPYAFASQSANGLGKSALTSRGAMPE